MSPSPSSSKTKLYTMFADFCLKTFSYNIRVQPEITPSEKHKLPIDPDREIEEVDQQVHKKTKVPLTTQQLLEEKIPSTQTQAIMDYCEEQTEEEEELKENKKQTEIGEKLEFTETESSSASSSPARETKGKAENYYVNDSLLKSESISFDLDINDPL